MQFKQLPKFKPELMPTPGTPKELPTTPDAVLSSYRKKRKNSTGRQSKKACFYPKHPVCHYLRCRIVDADRARKIV